MTHPVHSSSSTASTMGGSLPSTSGTKAGSKTVEDLARNIFKSKVASFTALPASLQAKVIIAAIKIHGVDKLSTGGYLTQVVIGNALNQGLSLVGLEGSKTILDKLITYNEKSQTLTISAPDLKEDQLMALFQQIKKEECSSCTTIYLNNTTISNFKFLSRFPNVKIVVANQCISLTSLEGIPKKVQRLEVSSSGIIDLNALTETEVTLLIASDCQNLQDISGLAKLPLEYLDLGEDRSLEDLSTIKELSKLRTLVLKGLPLLDDIDGFSALPSLTKLDVRECSVIEEGAQAFQKKNPKVTILS